MASESELRQALEGLKEHHIKSILDVSFSSQLIVENDYQILCLRLIEIGKDSLEDASSMLY